MDTAHSKKPADPGRELERPDKPTHSSSSLSSDLWAAMSSLGRATGEAAGKAASEILGTFGLTHSDHAGPNNPQGPKAESPKAPSEKAPTPNKSKTPEPPPKGPAPYTSKNPEEDLFKPAR